MSNANSPRTSGPDFIALAALAGGVCMALCQWLVYVYAPLEQTMGAAQKIFYIHLPVAWWCFVSFAVACVCGIAYLKTRKEKWDLLSYAAVEVGMVCTTLALITGSIWAKHSWGVWWTWDPRLTTALILWFIYAGYMALRSMDMPPQRQASLGAVVAVVGFLDVPLVFMSARLWRSIHPAVFASRGGGMVREMAVAVIASVLCFGLVWLALIGIRYRQKGLDRRLNSLLFARMANEDNN